MTYEERAEAIAEEKNEHRQIVKHFEDLNREQLEEQLSDALTQLEEVKANADYQIEGRELEIKELKEKHERSISQWKYELNKSIQNEVILSKENKQLKAQIEKMKNCFNCKHSIYNGGVCINPNKRYKDCRDFSSWELKE